VRNIDKVDANGVNRLDKIDPTDHLNWVSKIAMKVARNYGLTDSHLDDLTSAGVLKTCELAKRFCPPAEGLSDPVGAFRGYAFRAVTTACQREAERLLNGGGYWARRRIRGQLPVISIEFSRFTKDVPAGELPDGYRRTSDHR
jgi:hypothetical protein